LRSRPLAGLTILVVEDMEDSLDATSIMLEVFGAKVLVARDGLEALAVVAAGRPHLVLCDLVMPRMNGFTFLTELRRARGPDCPPVVAVTGLVTEDDQQRTRVAGFAGHLKKPFDDVALISTILKAIGRSRLD
jgi:CheY-like chemotaxis protein